jgi:hypothetical protein
LSAIKQQAKVAILRFFFVLKKRNIDSLKAASGNDRPALAAKSPAIMKPFEKKDA